MAEPRYRPVVAIDVDGVLRVTPGLGLHRVAAYFNREITMRRDTFPSLFHREPPWDERGEWTYVHSFSDAGVAWVQSLLDRGIDVVWASTWQEHANTYFADALGLPALPVAVIGDQSGPGGSPVWKTSQLARQFDGRPLIWVDDNPVTSISMRFQHLRRKRDRIITRFYWVRNWNTGITPADVEIMDEWVELTRTEHGHDELRRRRKRDLARARARHRRDRWGSDTNYQAWRTVRDRLRTALGPDSVLPTLIADYTHENPTGIDPADIAAMVEEWGSMPARPVDDADLTVRIVRILGREGFDIRSDSD